MPSATCIDRLSTVPGVARVSLNGGGRVLDARLAGSPGTRRSPADGHRYRRCAPSRERRVACRPHRVETREFTLRTLVGLQNEQDFRDLVVARGADGHLIRLGEVANVQLAAESDRADCSLQRPVRRVDGGGGAVESEHAGHRSRRARRNRQVAEPLCRAARRWQVGVDNGIAIEAALREVIIAVVFALISVLLVIYAFLGSLRRR